MMPNLFYCVNNCSSNSVGHCGGRGLGALVADDCGRLLNADDALSILGHIRLVAVTSNYADVLLAVRRLGKIGMISTAGAGKRGRPPVGSVARMMGRVVDQALGGGAIATRCCWPPARSWLG